MLDNLGKTDPRARNESQEDLKNLIAIIKKRIEKKILSEEEKEWIEKLCYTSNIECFAEAKEGKRLSELLTKLTDEGEITDSDLQNTIHLAKNAPTYLKILFSRARKENLLILLGKKLFQDYFELPYLPESLFGSLQQGLFSKLMGGDASADKEANYAEFIQNPFTVSALNYIKPIPLICNITELSDIANLKPFTIISASMNLKTAFMLNVFLGATALNIVTALAVVHASYNFVNPREADYKRNIISIIDNNSPPAKFSSIASNVASQLGTKIKTAVNTIQELLPNTYISNIQSASSNFSATQSQILR